jgi:3-keto-5-aminohexanoate cleavage enzyme
VERLIVAVGLNEGVTRAQNPNVPITPAEIADDIKECIDAGATVFHVHARDPETEANTWSDIGSNLALFRAATAAHPDAIVYPTYPGEGNYTDRYKHVVALAEDPEIRFEIAPVMAGPVNRIFNHGHEDLAERGYGFMASQSPFDMTYQIGIANKYDLWISHDIFEPGHIRAVASLFARGVHRRPVLLKFFMSADEAFGLAANVRSLEVYCDLIPAELDCEWLTLPTATGFEETRAMWEWAIANGGHVRVGVGDNPRGEGFGQTNAAQVAQVVELARSLGREIATAADIRARFQPIVR